jgi:UDP-GlcNAc3NAcA epimerase
LSHGAMTDRMLEEIEEILLIEKPSALMVYGDTNSTLAGALAAVKLHIPVAHVEAGLRSFNLKMPEEINRILADRISSFLFCPTEKAVENLKNEGFDYFPAKVFNTGDVMYDVALHYGIISPHKSRIIHDLKLTDNPFILATLHRQENTDNPARLSELCKALNALSQESKIVFPLHPRTRNVLDNSNIRLNFDPIDPIGYFDMIELMKNCSFVLTDSGGVQKESFFFKKHCLVARDETEWTELVDLGYNFIVGANKEKILESSQLVTRLNKSFEETPYGNGNAAMKIAGILKEI